VDTSCDVNFSASIKTRKLGHLAAEHGFLNPFAHRALFDVLTMLRVLSFYDHKDVIKLAGEKDYVVQALVEKPWLDSGKSTSEAKENGFRWNGERKLWLKRVKESQLQSVEKQGSYRVVVLEE
jgi:DNA polymerase-3 subunit epsilon